MKPVVGEPQATVAVPTFGTHVASPAPAPPGVREDLAALVLLGGTMRPTDLSRGLDRALAELPVDAGVSVVAHWQREAGALAVSCGGAVSMRVIVDAASALPRQGGDVAGVRFAVERDKREFRGTGGVLRDACDQYPPELLVLVANANQILVEPLEQLLRALRAAGGDIAILAHDDGAPVGLMLVRVAALLSLRTVGFIDFKEQALPRLASKFDVRVVHRPVATGVPIRTRQGYLHALRAYHRVSAGLEPFEGPFAEDWVRTFGVVEPGASVASDARVHDSVVLAGARVDAGAVLVRSVVCGGARVRSGEVIADRVVAPADEGRAT